jgi:hypothetical protein
MLIRTLNTMCETVAHCHSAGASVRAIEPPYDDAAQFVLEALRRMPAIYSVGVKGLTCFFACAGVAYGGRSFRNNSLPQRIKQWKRWQSHRIALCRDLVKLYESLILLTLYSRPGVVNTKAMEAVGALR